MLTSLSQAAAKRESLTWYLDTGATSHMTCQRHWLHDFHHIDDHQIRLGNDDIIHATGSGTIRGTIRHNGKDITIQLDNVLYIPSLAKNLISPNRLTEIGFSAIHDRSGYTLYRRVPSEPFLHAIPTSGMLQVPLHVQPGSPYISANIAEQLNLGTRVPFGLLHRRLGHISEARLQQAIKSSDLQVTPSPLGLCECCIKGKQTRATIRHGPVPRATKPLQIVHSDVCGPMSVESFSHKRYYVSFIDDYTRHAIIYFIREKSEVPLKFADYKALTAKIGTIQTLRSDQGGEYMGHDFQAYLQRHGIEHRPSPAYTPEFNGVAERFNRTILNMVRSMLFDADLTRGFWAEAALTAVYINNCLPTKANGGKSPHELWTGQLPRLDHIHVFGCRAHLLIPSSLCDKLQPRCRNVIYMGPASHGSHHRVWNPATKTLSESRDVIFNELPNDRSVTMKLSDPPTPLVTTPTTDDTHMAGMDDTMDQ
ncbi:MAG: DDE-type integrase/transposase/recombinase, partial [Sulfobacillus sp.]